ncbi:MAG TPA: phosphate ABC transporter substrate-binding protein PstS [Pirellulales bacterium]|jgi:phosphate transport system substrate-binding protein|nr:phosphate ABC transporter substrate-binding protein PstS [Pirellulales bacterium]
MNSALRAPWALIVCAAAVVAPSCSKSDTLTINGSGASFPYPIYSKWAYTFQQLDGTRINYQSTGSSVGVTQVKQKTINFGASDVPLSEQELDEAGLVQFPLVIGGIVPVVHIAGVEPGTLKLSADVLAKIYLGEIKTWNDSAITALNPDLKQLPDISIAPIRRSDGSGTTWIFTNYLAVVSSDWKDKVGVGKEVSWPAGVGGKGNEGVAANVAQIEGSIGYVEYAYAVQNKMTYVLLQNRKGRFVAPSLESFAAAEAAAEKTSDWASAPGFYVSLVDQPGDETWPITGATFILIHKEQADAALAGKMLKFFDWCYRHGADAARGLHYVPIPAGIYGPVEATWDKEVRAGGKPIER